MCECECVLRAPGLVINCIFYFTARIQTRSFRFIAQYFAVVFVFVVSHLPVPNSDHHDHQKDKFLDDIMALHASYSLP